MLASNGKITMRQLQILIILGSMGTGLIILPRRVALYAGQDGWLITVGLVIVAVLVGLLISYAVDIASRTTQKDGFINFTAHLLSSPVAYFLGILLWIKLVFAAGLELSAFMEITNVIMLPNTPIFIVSIVMLAVCMYAAIKGMETRARVAEILFAIMVLPFLFLIGLAIFDIDFSNLQPVFVTPVQNLGNGIFRLGFMFAGMECLFFVLPFLRTNKNLGRSVAGALAFSGIIIVAITVLTIAKFGYGVTNETWPVLRMMDMLNIPGSFIERQEVLVFSFWIITAFAIGNMVLFFGGVLINDLFYLGTRRKRKPQTHKIGVFITTVCVFFISIVQWEDAYHMLDIMYITIGVFFLFILPCIIIIAAKIDSGISRRQALTTGSALLIVLAFTFMLTGCWDRVEIEDRAFVVSMGIDKGQEGEYIVTATVPLLKKDGDNDSDEPHHIKTASGKTITEAMQKLDAKTDKTLYYRQAKLLILGESLLDDRDMTLQVINALEQNQEIDLRINVLATSETVEEVMDLKPPGEVLPGLFVSELYRNKDKIGGTSFALDLERLSDSLHDGAIIPLLAKDGNDSTPLKLQGARVFPEGQLSQDELRGLLWCKNHANIDAIINISENTPVRIIKHSVSKAFFEADDEELQAHIIVKIIAEAAEPVIDTSHLKDALSKIITDEILETAYVLQHKYNLDGYDFLDTLRKKNYKLYKKYYDNWGNVFQEIVFVPEIVIQL